MIGLALLTLCAATAPAVPLAVQDPAAPTQIELLQGFLGELGRLRGGDDTALAPLSQIADRLCSDHSRCDATDVADFYAGISPEARRGGLEDEKRYLALRERVVDAGRIGLAGNEWASEREEVLGELRELILDVQFRPDFVPAAQALALCAQIELQLLEEAPGVEPTTLEPLTDQVARDAEAANVLFRTAGQVTPRLEPLWILGRVERRRGRPSIAREAFERCREQATRVHNDHFRERALLGLLTLALDEGDVPGQERQLRRLAAFRAPNENWPVARGWGQLLLYADHAERALEFLREHEPLGERHPGDRIDWHLLMGGALMRLGMDEKARSHFESLAAGPSADLAALALARLAVNEGRPAEALRILERDELLPRLSAVDQAGWYALVGEARLLAGDSRAAVENLEYSLGIANEWSEAMAPHHGAAETTTRSVMGEWAGLHTVALLADAYARMGRPLKALAVIEDVQSRTLRGDTGEAHATPATEEDELSTGDILEWARQSELGLVTWVVGADFSVVAWAGPDGEGRTRAVARRIDLGRRPLEDAVRRLRESALSGDVAAVARISSQIRSALLPDELIGRLLEAKEAAPGDARLLALVHGPIERLPIELLELDGAPLDESMSILALPGLPGNAPGPAPAVVASDWVLLGAPTDTGGWPALPGAAAELLELGQLHPGARVIQGSDFKVPALEVALAGSRPVHIATHLVPECPHDDERLAPASLLLSGGAALCSHQVAALEPEAPLVVLAGCATAEGRFVDAEGLHGMARAFLEGGTRNVLVTLWPVEDHAAHVFAVAFHRALEDGATPSRAARGGRKALREEGFGPGDWGAFRLLGRD